MSFILSRDARASSYITLAYLVGMPFQPAFFPFEHDPLMPFVFRMPFRRVRYESRRVKGDNVFTYIYPSLVSIQVLVEHCQTINS